MIVTPAGVIVAVGGSTGRGGSGGLCTLRSGVRITVSQYRFRPSISIFNDMNDIDRLLAALPKTPPA